MEDDDLFASLGRDWRHQPVDTDAIADRFDRYRRDVRRSMLATGVGAFLVSIAMIWFAWSAIVDREPVAIIAAAAYAAALPFLLTGLARDRLRSALRHEATALGLLRAMRQRAVTIQSMLWGPRWSARILLASVGAIWIAVAIGQVAVATVVLPTSAWVATALLLWAWQMRRGAKAIDEIARCDTLIAEFDRDNGKTRS